MNVFWSVDWFALLVWSNPMLISMYFGARVDDILGVMLSVRLKAVVARESLMYSRFCTYEMTATVSRFMLIIAF